MPKADGVTTPNGKEWRATTHVCIDGELWYGKVEECENPSHTLQRNGNMTPVRTGYVDRDGVW